MIKPAIMLSFDSFIVVLLLTAAYQLSIS